jgi:two-component system chemotaxis sensor kinase CheA
VLAALDLLQLHERFQAPPWGSPPEKDSARDAVVQEARELLVAMEAALLQIEMEGPSRESINAIFRAAHTIKGSAGLFAFDSIVQFTHQVEHCAGPGARRTPAAERAPDVACCCSVAITSANWSMPSNAARKPRNPMPSAVPPAGRAGDGGADCRAQRRSAPPSAQARAAASGRAWVRPAVTQAPADYPYWHLSLQFNENVLRDGLDPMSFLHYLRSLGRIVAILPVERAFPRLPDGCRKLLPGRGNLPGLGLPARRWRTSSNSCATTAASTSCRHAASLSAYADRAGAPGA